MCLRPSSRETHSVYRSEGFSSTFTTKADDGFQDARHDHNLL